MLLRLPQAKRMQDQIKIDEERVKAQRAASAHRTGRADSMSAPGFLADEEESTYSMGGVPRANRTEDTFASQSGARPRTASGYFDQDAPPPGMERGRSEGRSVGFNLSSYGGNGSEGGRMMGSPKGALTLDGPRPRVSGTAMGGMMMMGPGGQMQNVSPARLAALQQQQQAMMMAQTRQQQQLRADSLMRKL